MNQFRSVLTSILSADIFEMKDIERIFKLKKIIFDHPQIDFYDLVFNNLRIELFDLFEENEHSLILATVLGHAAILEWLGGDPHLMLKMIVENPDTQASEVAMNTLDFCFDIAKGLPNVDSYIQSYCAENDVEPLNASHFGTNS